jgi:hypothetical protein
MSSTAQSREEALALFLSGAERLATAVEGLTEASLDLSSAPGEWTIRQMVHHVADDGDAWSMPLKKAIAIPGAPIRFEGFPGNDAWAAAMAFDKRGVEASLGLIKAHRQVMAELARYFIDGWDSRCVVIVDERGKEVQAVTLGQIISMVGEHLADHVTAIENIKKRHGL